ncbi:MAG: BMP family ABC transporter substrate-binding protein [Anaerolineae bacterium]
MFGKMNQKILFLCVALVAVLALMIAQAGSAEAEALAQEDFSDLRIAMLTSGPINDEGWNQTAYEGLQVLEKAGAEIGNTENVAQADQLDLIRSYGDQGFNVIIGHGFEYGDALAAAAEEYPEVSFIQIGGIAENGTNLVSYVFRAGEGGYAAGILAGLMVESGKLGGVGAVEIPTIAADFNAFKIAAQMVNPNVTDVPVAYTGSWVDIPKANEAAIAQIDSGVELILANGDNANVGAIQAAADNGKTYVIGWTRDQNHLAPDLVLTSNEQRVDNILVEAIKEIKAGTMEWKNHLVGFKEKAQTFAPFNKAVPADVATEVNNVVEALADGRIILDDAGNVLTDTYHIGTDLTAETADGMKTFTLDELKENVKVDTFTINDPFYGAEKTYEGFWLKDLLDYTGTSALKGKLLIFRAADGYEVNLPLADLSNEQPQGFVAYKVVGAAEGDWDMIPFNGGEVNPGPYYMVWGYTEGSSDEDLTESHPWPWQLVEIEVQ